jgi:hypothetical protein
MHDPDHLLTRLLDHPPLDVAPPSDAIFTRAVMARLPEQPPALDQGWRALPWILVAAALLIACVLPSAWLSEDLDPTLSLADTAATIDTLMDLILASVALGVVLLVGRRSLA